MERRGKLQEMQRGCVGHGPGEMGQYMKEAGRERQRDDRDRDRETEWEREALGCVYVFPSESGSSSRGSPKAQGRDRRVLGKGAGPGQQLAKVRTPAAGALTLVGFCCLCKYWEMSSYFRKTYLEPRRHVCAAGWLPVHDALLSSSLQERGGLSPNVTSLGCAHQWASGASPSGPTPCPTLTCAHTAASVILSAAAGLDGCSPLPAACVCARLMPPRAPGPGLETG